MTKYLSLCLFLVSMQSQVSWASAWLEKKGDGDVLTNLRYQNGSTANQFEVNPYVEWGYTDDISFGGNFTYRNSRATVSTSDDFQVGAGELFAKKRLMQNDHNVLSVQLTLGTAADSLNGLSSNVNYSSNPVAEIRGLWGLSSVEKSWGHIFFNSEIAIRDFFGKKGNEWRGEESAGWETKGKHLFLAQFFWTKNWNQTLGSQDYDSVSFQPSYVYPVNEAWRVQGGINYTLGGRQVDYVPVYLLSIWYHW